MRKRERKRIKKFLMCLPASFVRFCFVSPPCCKDSSLQGRDWGPPNETNPPSCCGGKTSQRQTQPQVIPSIGITLPQVDKITAFSIHVLQLRLVLRDSAKACIRFAWRRHRGTSPQWKQRNTASGLLSVPGTSRSAPDNASTLPCSTSPVILWPQAAAWGLRSVTRLARSKRMESARGLHCATL